jgi:hypothetical protein
VSEVADGAAAPVWLPAMGWDECARWCIHTDKNKARAAIGMPAMNPIRTSGDLVCMEFLLSSFFPENVRRAKRNSGSGWLEGGWKICNLRTSDYPRSLANAPNRKDRTRHLSVDGSTGSWGEELRDARIFHYTVFKKLLFWKRT